MILLYSILALTASVYLVISAIMFFNHAEHYHTYRKVYKSLPEMKFRINKYHGSVHSIHCPFIYYTEDKIVDLDGEIYLTDGAYEYFDLYSWWYRRKFVKWFDNLE